MISLYTMSMRVLLVEDEHKTAAYVKRGLQESGYAVDAVFTGRDAQDWIGAAPYDLIILDVMLPVIDGLTICRELRQRGDCTPVLMLTARDHVDDRVNGLDAGADDYLVKPFAMNELLARMRALTRRSGDQPKSSILVYADLSLDTRTHQVWRSGKQILLTSKEFSILEYLLREPGHVLTRAQIAEHVWNYENFNQSNVVDVYIRNLRRKVDAPFQQRLIYTVRGVGYCLALYETD